MKKYISKLAFTLVTALIGLISCESEIPQIKPTIIGHRGLRHLFPENTKEAFDGLINNEIYDVELDLLMAAGDTVMVFHYLANGTIINTFPFTLKKAIKANSGGTGLTLEEYFDLYENEFNISYLDLKQGQGEIIYKLIDQLIELIQERNLYERVVITSPSEANLVYIQTKDPKIKLAPDEGRTGLNTAILHHFGYCLISISQTSEAFYNFAKLSGVKLIVYTAQNINETREVISMGCDGIMTDVPLEMKVLYGR